MGDESLPCPHASGNHDAIILEGGGKHPLSNEDMNRAESPRHHTGMGGGALNVLLFALPNVFLKSCEYNYSDGFGG